MHHSPTVCCPFSVECIHLRWMFTLWSSVSCGSFFRLIQSTGFFFFKNCLFIWTSKQSFFKNAEVWVSFDLKCLIVMWSRVQPSHTAKLTCWHSSLLTLALLTTNKASETARSCLHSNGVQSCTCSRLEFHCRQRKKYLKAEAYMENFQVVFSNCVHGLHHLPALHNLFVFLFFLIQLFPLFHFHLHFLISFSRLWLWPPFPSNPSLCVTLWGKAPLTSAS